MSGSAGGALAGGPAGGARASGSRAALHRAEALWWLSRLYLNNPPIWLVLMGWLAADASPPVGRTVALLAFIVCASSTVMILNDVMDAEADRVTAPYLPIASGALTRRSGVVAAAVLALAGLVALRLACTGWGDALLGLALMLGSIASTSVYSVLKDTGIAASFLVGIPFAAIALAGWVAGNGAGWFPIDAIVLYALLAGVSANVLAALRDVDLDPVVGNRTLAVRLGAPRAFQVAAVLGVAAGAPAALVVADRGGLVGALLLAAGLGTMAWAYRPALARFREPGRARIDRIADMRAFKLGEFLRHAAVVAAFAPLLALALAVLLQGMLVLGARAYRSRVVGGRLLAQISSNAY